MSAAEALVTLLVLAATAAGITLAAGLLAASIGYGAGWGWTRGQARARVRTDPDVDDEGDDT